MVANDWRSWVFVIALACRGGREHVNIRKKHHRRAEATMKA